MADSNAIRSSALTDGILRGHPAAGRMRSIESRTRFVARSGDALLVVAGQVLDARQGLAIETVRAEDPSRQALEPRRPLIVGERQTLRRRDRGSSGLGTPIRLSNAPTANPQLIAR